mmetsp:Transcript_13176/g.25582  ORF Transcript_13176/g.25582 Transcript_13176/m.25582 type:complete len:131 (+) Transcript_13176:997-1389(+)
MQPTCCLTCSVPRIRGTPSSKSSTTPGSQVTPLQAPLWQKWASSAESSPFVSTKKGQCKPGLSDLNALPSRTLRLLQAILALMAVQDPPLGLFLRLPSSRLNPATVPQTKAKGKMATDAMKAIMVLFPAL